MVKKILLVDDDPDILAALKRNIRHHFRKQKTDILIRQATNGEEAVNLANEDHPNLIIMDIRMPVMDGIQACSILRSNPLFDPTYIILLTGESGREVQGLSTGADDYITKPFDKEALVLRIEKGLEVASKRTVVIQDSETGLWTKEYFTNCRIEGELGRAKRHGRPLSFIMIRFSPREGLATLDDVSDISMSELAKLLPSRSADICVRWDENTFASLLPETDLEGAMIVTKGLRKHFSKFDNTINLHIGISYFDLNNHVEALPAFAETSLAVAQDTGQLVVNGKPVEIDQQVDTNVSPTVQHDQYGWFSEPRK